MHAQHGPQLTVFSLAWLDVFYIAYIDINIAYIDINIKFNQSVYSVTENDGYVEPVLVISSPLSTNITVIVSSSDGSADGEY